MVQRFIRLTSVKATYLCVQFPFRDAVLKALCDVTGHQSKMTIAQKSGWKRLQLQFVTLNSMSSLENGRMDKWMCSHYGTKTWFSMLHSRLLK